MAANNVRVIIPDNAAELILLSQDILDKHTADGAGSKLSGLNMADMQIKTTLADTQHVLAGNLSRDAETATQERDLALGAAESFLPGTVLFYITSIRDFLLGRFRGREQRLGDWEYEVNEASDGSITIEIPAKAADLITLAKGILAKHTADGAGTLLTAFDMADMQLKTTTAKTQHTLAGKLNRDAETATQKRDLALGHGKKQNSTTPGTVLFYVSSARDILMGIFRGREQELGDWGFSVDASTAPPPPSAGIVSITSNQSTLSGMPLEISISGNLSASGGGILATWEPGITNSADLTAGGTIVFQHVYTTTGIKTITAAEVTPGVFRTVSALQMPNVKATAITLSGDFSEATTFNFYGNDISLTNMYALITQINDYGTSGGQLNISGGTMPVPDPAFPALIALRSRGWVVTTN